MTKTTITIGFIPSYRGEWGAVPSWCMQMRSDGLAALAKMEGVKSLAPQANPQGAPAIDPQLGYTPDGIIANLDQGEAMAEFFQREKVDGLVICALNFGDERSAAKIAEKLNVPVLLYATREPPAPDSASLARVSDSYCGTLSIASALYRRKIRFHFAGIYLAEEPEFQRELETFVRAVAVVKALKGARIGQVGVRPAGFETVGYDEVALIRKFGQNVIYQDLSELVLKAQRLPDDDPRVQKTVAAMRGQVAEVSVGTEWSLKAAKMELAAGDFWREAHLSAMAMQCWPAIQNLWGFSTCALFGRLTEQGMLTACETDILGALTMLVQYSAALGEMVPHFIDWTIQHPQNPNWFLAWHCGNAPVCLAADPSKTAIRSRTDMKGSLPIREDDSQAGLYQFQVRPGKVTLCRLAEYDQAWKMLITRGEIRPSEETLAGTWAWVAVKDQPRLYRTLVEQGFIHHASLIHGDHVEVLIEACKFMDIQPVLVD
jgi:L-fucose isomerase-like protein